MSTLIVEEKTAQKMGRNPRPWDTDVEIMGRIRGQWSVRIPCDATGTPIKDEALRKYEAEHDINVSVHAQDVFAHERFGFVNRGNQKFINRWWAHDLVVLPAREILGEELCLDEAEALIGCLGFSLPFAETCLPLCVALPEGGISDGELRFERLIFLNRPYEADERVPRTLVISGSETGAFYRVDALISSKLRITCSYGLVVWNFSHSGLHTVE